MCFSMKNSKCKQDLSFIWFYTHTLHRTRMLNFSPNSSPIDQSDFFLLARLPRGFRVPVAKHGSLRAKRAEIFEGLGFSCRKVAADP